jgi:hypothetical protein
LLLLVLSAYLLPAFLFRLALDQERLSDRAHRHPTPMW